jgi:uncharacterized protein (UPF0335 family)
MDEDYMVEIYMQDLQMIEEQNAMLDMYDGEH